MSTIAVAEQRRASPGRGVTRQSTSTCRTELPTIVCRFDQETFDEVRRRAKAADRSFAAEVRTLIAAALAQQVAS